MRRKRLWAVHVKVKRNNNQWKEECKIAYTVRADAAIAYNAIDKSKSYNECPIQTFIITSVKS